MFNSKTIFQKSYFLILAVVLSFSHHLRVQATNIIKIAPRNITQSLTIEGTSGGAVMAQEIAQTTTTTTGYCDGYVSSQPNHLLQLESFSQLMRLEIASQADTTIVIKGPGGVWCNDDSSTTDPIIEGQWQPGLYKVWVGSYQPNVENPYQIKITGR